MGGGSFDPIFHTAPFIPPMMSGDLFHPQDTRNWGQPNSYFSSTSSYSVNRGRSESRSTSSINGLTTSVHEFVDSEVRAPGMRPMIRATDPRFPRVTPIRQPLAQMVA